MKNALKFALMIVLMLMTAAAAIAAEPFRDITAVELKGMLREGEPPVVIDTRSPAEYGEAHIEGALNIPLNDLNNNPGLLRYPPGRAIVFYCNGFT